MQNDRFYKMLGLSMRAGKLVVGEGAVSDNIRKGKAELVIIAEDASQNTKKKFRNSCDFYSVPCISGGDRYELGHFIGRSFAVVLAVCDKSFADALKNCGDE